VRGRLSWLIAATVAIAVVSCSGSPHRPPRTRLTVKQIVEKSKPAIVRVEGKDRVGTGFAIDPSGIIATNLHVVAGLDAITIKLFDGRSFDVKRVLAFDFERDLALLALDLQQPMPYLPIGDSTLVAAGDPVVAIGNPLGVLDYTVSDGLISSVREVNEQLTVLQISAPISQGSSGGPLFNPYGEVIGVATLISLQGQNLNFAVPSQYLKPLLEHGEQMTMAEFAEATSLPGSETAKIERQVPIHDLSVLDGCSDLDVEQVARGIAEAIDVGAPLYNRGDHESCFKIYEITSRRFEKDSACPGVREAFKKGLERAGAMESYTEKAWALRDTFDGLVDVIVRKFGKLPQDP
jgi:hypothetical protein